MAYNTKKFHQALKWFKKSAYQGFSGAQHTLGTMYHLAQYITKNKAIAFEWFEKAAKQGHAKAQYNLGLLYLNGHGVTQDYNTAKK